MRQQNCVGRGQKRRVFQRLLLKRVECRCRKLAALQRFRRRRFIDQTTAGSVDEDRAVLHGEDALSGNNVLCRLHIRHMHRNDVAVSHDEVNIRRKDIVLLCVGLVHKRVIRVSRHADPVCEPAKLLADGAIADDTDRFSEQLHPVDGGPRAASHLSVLHGDAPCAVQHQAKRKLRDRYGHHARRVGDRNAGLCRRRGIYLVIADAPSGDDLQLRAVFHDLCRDIVKARHIAVAAVQQRDQLVLCKGLFGLDCLYLSKLFQFFSRLIVHTVFERSRRYQYFHFSSFLIRCSAKPASSWSR